MANEEHLAILKQGVKTWNKWRKKHSDIKPDLRGADLYYATLSDADLRDADLRQANLCYADIDHANLSHANLSHALLADVLLSDANLHNATLNFADLSETYLSDANLSHAKLCSAKLYSAKLRDADLSHADLSQVNLCHATLYSADLSHANLRNADLSWADLRDANLANVNLSSSNLTNAILSSTNLTNARMAWTALGNVDLSAALGLETVTHERPSTIGIDTIYESKGNIPETFLRGAGVPDTMITFMHSLTAEAIKFYSCFISYSSKDQSFADRLYADLQAKGVRCWYAPEDLKIGEPFLLGIEQGIRLHDKLLLVLSEHSVASGWVQHEVLSAMAKEQGKAPWVLFPIRVDDAIMNTGVPWATMIKQSRHIGDFTHWKDHDAYQQAFDRLLRDLKAEG